MVFVCLNVVGVVFSMLQQLRGLVAMTENLNKQEQQFKLHCKVYVCVFIHVCACLP